MAHKILVVDDEKDVVETLAKRLAQEGLEVATAADGLEAVRKVAEFDPDLLLLDLMLPKLDGFGVLQQVRTHFNTRWRPVIIISGTTELNAVKKSYSLEADHYLTKPCTMEQVLRGVNTMISLIPHRGV